MFNFKRLIKKYGKYKMYHKEVVGEKIDMTQGGKLVQDIKNIPIEGALITEYDKVVYTGGGIAKESVVHLYTYNKLKENSTIHVELDGKDVGYNVKEIRDYSRFDIGLYDCILERSDR